MRNGEQGSPNVPNNGCPCPVSQYHYIASAYGFAAEMKRPIRQTIPTQAATVLGADGGQGHARVQDFKFNSFLTVGDARSEVGGSYDECHGIHTTYAYSALDKVNVADVLTADRVVSRLYIYHYGDSKETSYSITGSVCENLKIAGHKVEVKWPTSQFTAYETFSGIGEAGDWMVGSELAKLEAKALAGLEETYHALKGMNQFINRWKKKDPSRSHYFLSPANQIALEGHENATVKNNDWASAGIQVFGNVICIPKFGVIRLAELSVYQHFRSLTMFRVQMCSAPDGSTSGGGTSGGGGSMPGGL